MMNRNQKIFWIIIAILPAPFLWLSHRVYNDYISTVGDLLGSPRENTPLTVFANTTLEYWPLVVVAGWILLIPILLAKPWIKKARGFLLASYIFIGPVHYMICMQGYHEPTTQILYTWIKSHPGRQQREESSRIKLTLSKPELIDDKNILVELEIENTSSIDAKIFERWNSWGAFQWSFIVIIDEQSYIMKNPKGLWTRNHPSTFTMKPGEKLIVKCLLEAAGYKDNHGENIKGYNPREDWAFTSFPYAALNDLSDPEFKPPILIIASFTPNEEYSDTIREKPNIYWKVISNSINLKP